MGTLVVGLLAGPLTLAAGLAVVWIGLRSRLRHAVGATPQVCWCDAPAAPTPGFRTRAEVLTGLGYLPAGFVRVSPASPATATWGAFVHAELPAVALLSCPPSALYDRRCLAGLRTYFEDGGALFTTSIALQSWYSFSPRGGPVRLSQFRRYGEPGALHGQHRGTVKAWIAGGRQAAPICRETLLEQIGRDRAWVAGAILRTGWPSPTECLRLLSESGPGRLRF